MTDNIQNRITVKFPKSSFVNLSGLAKIWRRFDCLFCQLQRFYNISCKFDGIAAILMYFCCTSIDSCRIHGDFMYFDGTPSKSPWTWMEFWCSSILCCTFLVLLLDFRLILHQNMYFWRSFMEIWEPGTSISRFQQYYWCVINLYNMA